jgi:ribonuclease HII
VFANHAESLYPCVAAASILGKSSKRKKKNTTSFYEISVLIFFSLSFFCAAKVQRDSLVNQIANDHGVSFGSGYPSDVRTINFLREYRKKEGKFPDYARKQWHTVQRIEQELS